MSTNNTQLTQQIMRRIYIVAFMRRFLRPFVVKGVLLTGCVLMSFTLVSVNNVIINASRHASDVPNLAAFFFGALSRTEFVVQILFAGIVLLVIGLCVDAIRSFVSKQHIPV